MYLPLSDPFVTVYRTVCDLGPDPPNRERGGQARNVCSVERVTLVIRALVQWIASDVALVSAPSSWTWRATENDLAKRWYVFRFVFQFVCQLQPSGKGVLISLEISINSFKCLVAMSASCEIPFWACAHPPAHWQVLWTRWHHSFCSPLSLEEKPSIVTDSLSTARSSLLVWTALSVLIIRCTCHFPVGKLGQNVAVSCRCKSAGSFPPVTAVFITIPPWPPVTKCYKWVHVLLHSSVFSTESPSIWDLKGGNHGLS